MKKKKVQKRAPARSKYKCFRCEKTFPSRKMLKLHSKFHLQALHELNMLKEGHIPEETKFGAGFKGKNRIIVAED